MTSLATIGRADGKGTVTFRINPNSVDWNFQINTTVIDTLGGRVVQVLGATLSDMQVRGSYGEDRSKAGVAKGTDDGPGRSWRLAEAFVKNVESLMEYQSQNPTPMTSKPVDTSKVTPYLRFTFPLYGWDFLCYVKDLSDPDGGSITHKTGKFSYDYVLTLFLIQDNSSLNVLQGKAAQAADDYIARISQGISWDRNAMGRYSSGSVSSAVDGSGSDTGVSAAAETDLTPVGPPPPPPPASGAQGDTNKVPVETPIGPTEKTIPEEIQVHIRASGGGDSFDGTLYTMDPPQPIKKDGKIIGYAYRSGKSDSKPTYDVFTSGNVADHMTGVGVGSVKS